MNRGLGVALTLALLCGWNVPSSLTAESLRREFEKTVPLRGGGSVQLKNVTGKTMVTGWDREEVQVRAIITCDREPADEDLRKKFEKVEVVVEHDWNGVKIRTQYPDTDWDGEKPALEDPDFDFDIDLKDGEHGAFADEILGFVGKVVGGVTGWVSDMARQRLPVEVHYEVSVPRECNVQLKTVTGELLITGIKGEIETSLVTGHTAAVDVVGKLEGNVVTGELEIENGAGVIEASVITGKVSITLARDGEFNGLDCSVINGDILVRVPPELKAFDCDIKSVNGQVKLDTDLMSGVMKRGSGWKGSINGGGPKLDIKAINGSIRVERAVQ